MGKISNTINYYFGDSKRFADLFNAVFFQGRMVVEPEALSAESEIYHQPVAEKPEAENSGIRVERVRDVCKKLRTGGVLRILALENQNLVDYAMPFRCMQYDTMEYGKQLNEIRRRNEREGRLNTSAEVFCGLLKKDRIEPVYTLCLYHGEEEWDGPRSLKDMVNFEGKEDIFEKLFNDYPLRLYCLNEAENFEMFHTEVKQLFQALQYRKDRAGLRRLLVSDPAYRHLDKDTLEAMAVLLNMPAVWEKKTSIMSTNGDKEEYDMCQAVREWAEEERQIGRDESRVAIVKNLVRRGDTDEAIMQVVECSREYIANIRKDM
ncbi:MAG: Rpn family recombination-promoting nuclease/putative transposase [Acetatifactor sp.]|nr:Rpn family recombination-promoting nuclease/putative transposase [Acetatifactor sp.]